MPSYQSEDLHKAIPGSRLVIVEEGGHYSYRRHWQEWNKMVDAFLKETEGGVLSGACRRDHNTRAETGYRDKPQYDR